MIRTLAFLAGLLLPAAALGQSFTTPTYMNGATPKEGTTPVSPATPLPVTGSTGPLPTAYQGTLSVTSSAAISTLTLSGGTTYPVGAQGLVFILNSGSNTAYICWFGGTCSAGSGSFPLVAGASVSKNLGASTTVPTVFSTSGTTLAITN